MEFTWQHQGQPMAMKRFLTTHAISMRTIKAIKHGTGAFLVNNQVQTGVITIHDGDIAGIQLPDEAPDTAVVVSVFWLYLAPPEVRNTLDPAQVAEHLRPALIEALMQ